MLKQTIQLFGNKEEEFVNLLIEFGTRKSVAKILVYLTNIRKRHHGKSRGVPICASPK